MNRHRGLVLAALLGGCSEPQTPSGLGQQLMLEAVSEQNQSVPLAGVVALPRVRVVDLQGNPQSGVRVYFARSLGRPNIDGTIRTTGPTGETSLIYWNVGTRAGPQEVSAVIANNSSDTRAVFRVDVQPGPPTNIGLSTDTVYVAVGASSQQLALARRDSYGNVVDVVPGATLTSDDASIVEVLADGSLRGVSTGRAAVVVDSGAFRRAALVIVGNPLSISRTTLTVSAHEMYAATAGPTGVVLSAPFTSGPSQGFRLGAGSTTPTTFAMDSALVIDAAFRPDGSQALFVGLDRQYVLFLDAATGAVAHVVNLPATAFRVEVSADGSFAVVTGATRVWRIALPSYDVTEFPLPAMGGAVNGLAIHPADGRIFVASHGGYLAVLDPVTGAHLQYEGGFGRLQGLAIDAVGNRLYVAREFDGVRVLDAQTLVRISDSNPFSGAFDLRWDATRRNLWVSLGSADGVLRFSESALVALERITVARARRIAVLPSGDIVVAGATALHLIRR